MHATYTVFSKYLLMGRTCTSLTPYYSVITFPLAQNENGTEKTHTRAFIFPQDSSSLSVLVSITFHYVNVQAVSLLWKTSTFLLSLDNKFILSAPKTTVLTREHLLIRENSTPNKSEAYWSQ